MKRVHMKSAVIAFVVAAATSGAPAIAEAVARFAENADKVDGFHAVGAKSGRDRRAGKLLATNSHGSFPNNVIERAPDSARLKGRGTKFYQDTPCEVALVTAEAFVPADVSSEYVQVPGTTYRDFVGPGIAGPRRGCTEWFTVARRVATGVYQVDFTNAPVLSPLQCSEQLHSLVTLKTTEFSPLIANTLTLCEGNRAIEEIHVYDANGVPRDASFTIVLFSELPAIPFP